MESSERLTTERESTSNLRYGNEDQTEKRMLWVRTSALRNSLALVLTRFERLEGESQKIRKATPRRRSTDRESNETAVTTASLRHFEERRGGAGSEFAGEGFMCFSF